MGNLIRSFNCACPHYHDHIEKIVYSHDAFKIYGSVPVTLGTVESEEVVARVEFCIPGKIDRNSMVKELRKQDERDGISYGQLIPRDEYGKLLIANTKELIT